MSSDKNKRAGFEGYEAWREKRLAERLAEPIAESEKAPWNHLISVLLYAADLHVLGPKSLDAFHTSIESLRRQTYRNVEITVLRPGQYIETEGQVWAEPLLDSAVAALRAIYDDPDEAAARARRGQAFLRERHGPIAVGSRIEELLGQRNLP